MDQPIAQEDTFPEIPDVGRAASSISFERTVDRRLVHRHSLSEVFLTDSTRLGRDRFGIGVQWPRWHLLYDGYAGYYDGHLVAETIRQISICIAHRYLKVPFEQKFPLSEMSLELAPEAGWRETASTNVVVVVSTEVRFRNGLLSRLDAASAFYVGGELVARGSSVAQLVAPRVYRRLRRNARSLRAAAEPRPALPRVPSQPERNTVLDDSSPVPFLVVDTHHPVFFDHPLDHVPGMLLFVAAQQAAQRAAGFDRSRIVAMGGTFEQPIELWDPVRFLAVPTDAGQGRPRMQPWSVEVLVHSTVRARIQLILEFPDPVVTPFPEA
ncbi:MAG: hypothetical protein L0G87_03140 [Renibacterium salmoninarum]|nr:hypothetical protein [Renibacterium salmoninarum]